MEDLRNAHLTTCRAAPTKVVVAILAALGAVGAVAEDRAEVTIHEGVPAPFPGWDGIEGQLRTTISIEPIEYRSFSHASSVDGDVVPGDNQSVTFEVETEFDGRRFFRALFEASFAETAGNRSRASL